MKRTSSVLVPVCLQMEVAATVTVSLMLASLYTIDDDCKIDTTFITGHRRLCYVMGDGVRIKI